MENIPNPVKNPSGALKAFAIAFAVSLAVSVLLDVIRRRNGGVDVVAWLGQRIDSAIPRMPAQATTTEAT